MQQKHILIYFKQYYTPIESSGLILTLKMV